MSGYRATYAACASALVAGSEHPAAAEERPYPVAAIRVSNLPLGPGNLP